MDMDNITAANDDLATATITAKAKSSRKLKGKQVDTVKAKRSLNLSLPYEDYQRLALHALDRDVTISEIVSELVTTHLRSVHLTRTAKPTTGE